MLQLVARRIINDVIEDAMQVRGHVDSDVIAVERRRSASEVGVTSQEIGQLMTDAHNAVRRSVSATNMELMVVGFSTLC